LRSVPKKLNKLAPGAAFSDINLFGGMFKIGTLEM